ncbi:unnamed protein product, partial [Ectocarpus sp. 12 AP-2014]
MISETAVIFSEVWLTRVCSPKDPIYSRCSESVSGSLDPSPREASKPILVVPTSFPLSLHSSKNKIETGGLSKYDNRSARNLKRTGPTMLSSRTRGQKQTWPEGKS